MTLGCPEWHQWTSLWPVNYILYFMFSVCVSIDTIVRGTADKAADPFCPDIRKPG